MEFRSHFGSRSLWCGIIVEVSHPSVTSQWFLTISKIGTVRCGFSLAYLVSDKSAVSLCRGTVGHSCRTVRHHRCHLSSSGVSGERRVDIHRDHRLHLFAIFLGVSADESFLTDLAFVKDQISLVATSRQVPPWSPWILCYGKN